MGRRRRLPGPNHFPMYTESKPCFAPNPTPFHSTLATPDSDNDIDQSDSTAESVLRDVCMHNLSVLHLAVLEGTAPVEGAEDTGVIMCPAVSSSLQLPPNVVFGATGVALRASATVAYEP